MYLLIYLKRQEENDRVRVHIEVKLEKGKTVDVKYEVKSRKGIVRSHLGMDKISTENPVRNLEEVRPTRREGDM